MWQIKTSTLFGSESMNFKLSGLWFWFSPVPPPPPPLLIISAKQKTQILFKLKIGHGPMRSVIDHWRFSFDVIYVEQ